MSTESTQKPKAAKRKRHPVPDADAVVVHQIGKVGSMSIFTPLRKHLAVPVFHTHVLHSDMRYFHEDDPTPPPGRAFIPPHVVHAKRVRARFLRHRKPLAVISLVREPVGRNISAFFENLRRFPHLRTPTGFAPFETMRDTFFKEWPHHEMEEWFDDQVLQPLGVDVFQKPFNREKGFGIFRHHQHKFLIMHTELPDHAKARAVRRFLDFEGFRLAKSQNVGAQKEYAESYKEFLARIELPEAYLDEMYQSRYATHFYSPKDIAKYRAKWSRTPGAAR